MSSSNAVALKQPSSGAVALSSSQRVRKRPVKKALEEEEFTESLKTIVCRDFFPDVPKLEAQLEFIEASESNDYDKIREISERFSTTTHTPAPSAATPSTFETPLTTPLLRGKLKNKDSLTVESADQSDTPPDVKKQKLEDGKSLDQFLSKYQSEDDASFGEIMDKAAEEHRQKHAWLYAKEQEYSQNALESSAQPLAITDSSSDGKTDTQLMIELRPAGLNSWNYTAKNTLMYIPDGVEHSSKELVEGATKGREIVHSNTRLSKEFVRRTQAKLAKVSEGEEGGGSKGKSDKIGVDGKMLGPSETPNVNGYGFVATPQIHPGVDASPLMTWGSIDGTPFRLDTDITPSSGPTFKMPKIPKREELAIKLAEKSANATRERKKAAILAASPALLRQKLGASPSTVDRYQLLSPAARKLVARTTPRGTDKALKASYTPQRTPVVGGTPQSTLRAGATPKEKTVGGSTPSLTDNLLNLSKR